MNQRWGMFVAGSLLGAALGSGFGVWGGRAALEREQRKDGLTEGGGWREAGGGRSGSLAGKAGERVAGVGGRSGGGEDLLALAGELNHMESLAELNMMELIRQAFTVTQMSEGEVVALLGALESKEFLDVLGESDEFQAIIGLMALSRLAEVNGPEAMRLLMTAEEDSYLAEDRDEYMAMCMTAWVTADPAGALRWLEESRGGNADGELRELVSDPDFNAVVAGALARTDSDAARKFVDEADEETRAAGMAALARRELTAEGVIKLLDSTGAAEVEARRSVLETWAERDPQAAAAWLDAQGAAVEGRVDLLREVAGRYISEDPAAGAAWYMAQDAPEVGEGERYALVAENWVWQDADAAGAWLEGQPDGPARDAAEAYLARAASISQRWSDGFRWVGGIHDEERRTEALEGLLDRGVGEDGAVNPDFATAAEEAGFGDAVDALVTRKGG